MDPARASTIPLRMFINEHESLSKLIQVTTASLWYLSKETLNGNAPPLTKIFDDYAPYWGHPPIAELSSDKRDIFTSEIARLGVIRAISALDQYTTSLSAEIDSLSTAGSNSVNSSSKLDTTDEDDKPPRIITFSKRIGMSVTDRQEILCEFVNVLRNCCAHRAGHASKKMVEMLGNEHVISSLTIQSKKESKKQWIELFPELKVGDVIALRPVHAIWASDICLELAREINVFIISKWGEEGLLRSAIFNLNKIYYISNNANTFETTQAAINFMLSQMRLSTMNEVDLIKLLKRKNLWNKAVEKFRQLKVVS